jgi:hypothetical protein
MPNIEERTLSLKLSSDYLAKRSGWIETTGEIANRYLEAVPPRYRHGDKFACGECYDFTDAGRVYVCFRRITERTAEARIYTIDELRAS